MKTFRNHLNTSLKDNKFKEMYDEEKELLQLSIALHEARKKAGISQKEIADQARLTQQQISKLENGINCNIMTYMKVSHAIGFKLALQPQPRKISRPRNQHITAGKARSPNNLTKVR